MAFASHATATWERQGMVNHNGSSKVLRFMRCVTAADVLPLPAMARNPAALFFDGVVKSPDGMMLSLVPEGLRPQAATRAVGASLASLPEIFPPAVGMPAAVGHTGKIICFSTTD